MESIAASRSYGSVSSLVGRRSVLRHRGSPVIHVTANTQKFSPDVSEDNFPDAGLPSRRAALAGLSAAALLAPPGRSSAVSSSRRALRETQIPESDYKTMENGLKYYDIKVGGGKAAKLGDRVTVHYVVKWKNITFMTSRQGAGVTGGTPYGFDVGASETGRVLKGLDAGVEGMRVGGVRQLIVPPQLAYGNRGVQEIPPNATLDVNVELLSIKQNAFGTPVKLVEG